MAIPPACQAIADRLQDLKDQKSSLQADLKEPGLTTDMKNKIVLQIKQLDAQISQAQKDLNTCIANNP